MKREKWENFLAGFQIIPMLMFSQSLVNYFTTLLFSKKVIVQENLYIILNGEQKIFIFTMLTSKRVKKWFLIMTSWFLNSVGHWSQMKEKYSALGVGIRIMFAVTGCWNMTIISRNLKIEVLSFLEDQISQPYIQREALFLSSEGMMRKVSILHARSMTYKMTRGAE